MRELTLQICRQKPQSFEAAIVYTAVLPEVFAETRFLSIYTTNKVVTMVVIIVTAPT